MCLGVMAFYTLVSRRSTEDLLNVSLRTANFALLMAQKAILQQNKT